MKCNINGVAFSSASRILTINLPDYFFLKVVNVMAEFQYHASDDLQDAAFSWLKKGCYWKAFESFQELISQTKLKLNHVQGVQFNETLCILGKLRRRQAEALWHMGRFDHALKEMQLCKTENCHEFSEVSEKPNVIRSSRSLGSRLDIPQGLQTVSFCLCLFRAKQRLLTVCNLLFCHKTFAMCFFVKLRKYS